MEDEMEDEIMTHPSVLWYPRKLVATNQLPPIIKEDYNNSIQEYIDSHFAGNYRKLVCHYFSPTNTPVRDLTTDVLTIDITIPLILHTMNICGRECPMSLGTDYFYSYCTEHLKKDNPIKTVLDMLHLDHYSYSTDTWCRNIINLCVNPVDMFYGTSTLLQLAKRKHIYENYMSKNIVVKKENQSITSYITHLHMLIHDMSNYRLWELTNIQNRHKEIMAGVPSWLVCRTSKMMERINSKRGISQVDRNRMEYLQHHKEVLDREKDNLAILSNTYKWIYPDSCVEITVHIFDDVCTTPLQVELAIRKHIVAAYGEEIAQVILPNMFTNI